MGEDDAQTRRGSYVEGLALEPIPRQECLWRGTRCDQGCSINFLFCPVCERPDVYKVEVTCTFLRFMDLVYLLVHACLQFIAFFSYFIVLPGLGLLYPFTSRFLGLRALPLGKCTQTLGKRAQSAPKLWGSAPKQQN